MRILLLPPLASKTSTNIMAKTAALPASSINHAVDTIITLPKSKMIFVVKKNYSAKKLAIMDDYFSTHTISTAPDTKAINPYYQWCPLRYDTNWVLQNQYQPVAGKYLGIWSDKLSPMKLHNQYGFTYYVVGFGQSGDTSITNYFPLQNLMVNLPLNVNQQEIQNDPAYNYYYLDEPLHNEIVNSYFLNMANWISIKNPNAFFLFSEWEWPENDPLCWPNEDDGSTIKTYWFPNPNVRIMCDQYSGNGCGSAHDYWNEYKAYYGIPSRNMTNWISLDYSSEWGTLLNLANPWGMNPIWIYGGDSDVNEGFFESFANTAWETIWLLRQQGQLVTVWQNTDGTCDPTNGKWTLVDSYYIAYRWTYY